MKKEYHIIGRRGAGSLIAEFLFEEIDVPYTIEFPGLKENKNLVHPLGKIPILICPDGNRIYETLAIINHITHRFDRLSPKSDSIFFDRYWQFLSLLATSVYPAYHRQHHSRYYVPEHAYEELRSRAKSEQALIYDYIENELNPFICKDNITAADFYLYMLTRWDLDKTSLREKRPKLTFLIDTVRNRPSVAKVLEGQKKYIKSV
tara:strand:- start:21 stop:635 length:615 start_codon:yes stop_codon:yes gene_type:complete